MLGKFTKYEIPNSINELFQNKEQHYSIIDYNTEMNNIESMNFFLNKLDIGDSFIVEDNGTQVELKHPDFTYRIIIDAGGLGDFFSHGFAVTVINS